MQKNVTARKFRALSAALIALIALALGIILFAPTHSDVPVAFAEGESPEELTPTSDEYFTFAHISSGYSVSAKDYNNMPSVVVIPSTYNGEPVTSIESSAFYGCSGLTSVKF